MIIFKNTNFLKQHNRLKALLIPRKATEVLKKKTEDEYQSIQKSYTEQLLIASTILGIYNVTLKILFPFSRC